MKGAGEPQTRCVRPRMPETVDDERRQKRSSNLVWKIHLTDEGICPKNRSHPCRDASGRNLSSACQPFRQLGTDLGDKPGRSARGLDCRLAAAAHDSFGAVQHASPASGWCPSDASAVDVAQNHGRSGATAADSGEFAYPSSLSRSALAWRGRASTGATADRHAPVASSLTRRSAA